MTAKIIVGYSLQFVQNVETLTNTGSLEPYKYMPYASTFKQVTLVEPKNKNVFQCDYHEDQSKPPICIRVRNFLMKLYPNGWGSDYNPHKPPFRIYAFDPKCFLHILGLECSLPYINRPLPLNMWYSNDSSRDILKAIYPNNYIDLVTVLQKRKPIESKSREKWDAILNGWQEPFIDSLKDAALVIELAAQLGFLDES